MQPLQAIKTDKPFLDALNGIVAERPPVWFMRQAGRYLPEYRELRSQKGGFLDMAFDPEAASEITMQPIRRFDLDAAIIFSDILTIPLALGQQVEFVEGEGPKLGELNIRTLNYANFTRLNEVYHAITATKDKLKAEGYENTALIGFCGAPWTVATYMIEGGSSKDFIKSKRMMIEQPQAMSSLMNMLVEASATYLINQINAGAEAVQIFDSWAGSLDAQNFKRWCIRPMQQIIELVRAAHPHVPIIGFPKGVGQNALKYAQTTGITAIGIDHTLPTDWAARTLQPVLPVQGNLDPAYLLCGGDPMIMAAEQILGDLKNGAYVFNLGHGVHKETPPEHVEALVNFVKGRS